MKNLLTLFIVVLCFAAACSKSETDQDTVAPEIEFKEENISPAFSDSGGSTLVHFTVNSDWNVVVKTGDTRSEEWCTVHPLQGTSGDAAITIETLPNKTHDERKATIIIRSGTSVLSSFDVVQKQKDAITVSPSKIEIGAEGSVFSVEILSNIDFEYTVEGNEDSWIVPVATKTMTTTKLKFQASENIAIEPRSAAVVIKSNLNEEKIEVFQSGSEKPILIEFYESLGGDNWINNENWCSDKPIREWYGIECNEDGKVKDLCMPENNLSGTIPASLGKLTELEQLNLSRMNITGSIPSTIGNLKKLGYLNLSFNKLTGPIPAEICNLKDLGALYLDYNQLTGNIPEGIGTIPALRALWLHNNSLTGSIPASVSNIIKKGKYKGYPWVRCDEYQILPEGRIDESPIPEYFPPAEVQSFDLSCSIYNPYVEDLIGYYATECDFDPDFRFDKNNLSGKIPEELASSEYWNGFTGWLALNQNAGYGFNIESTKLFIPDYVECSLVGGGTFTRESCKDAEYTLFCRYLNDQELLSYIMSKYQDKGFAACIIVSHDADRDKQEWADLILKYKLCNLMISISGDDVSPLYSSYDMRFGCTFPSESDTLFLFDKDGKLVFHASGHGGMSLHLWALDAFLAEKFLQN